MLSKTNRVKKYFKSFNAAFTRLANLSKAKMITRRKFTTSLGNTGARLRKKYHIKWSDIDVQ